MFPTMFIFDLSDLGTAMVVRVGFLRLLLNMSDTPSKLPIRSLCASGP